MINNNASIDYLRLRATSSTSTPGFKERLTEVFQSGVKHSRNFAFGATMATTVLIGHTTAPESTANILNDGYRVWEEMGNKNQTDGKRYADIGRIIYDRVGRETRNYERRQREREYQAAREKRAEIESVHQEVRYEQAKIEAEERRIRHEQMKQEKGIQVTEDGKVIFTKGLPSEDPPEINKPPQPTSTSSSTIDANSPSTYDDGRVDVANSGSNEPEQIINDKALDEIVAETEASETAKDYNLVRKGSKEIIVMVDEDYHPVSTVRDSRLPLDRQLSQLRVVAATPASANVEYGGMKIPARSFIQEQFTASNMAYLANGGVDINPHTEIEMD